MHENLNISTPNIWLVVPAGGVGQRMGGDLPKQYLPIQNLPIIEHTLKALCAIKSIDGLIMGLSASDNHWKDNYAPTKLKLRVDAGKSRAQTVENCLHAISAFASFEDWVLVHDAVRPCIKPSEVEQLIEIVLKTGIGGILATPINDTIKRTILNAQAQEKIECSIPRERLWRAMTPQMFKLGDLLKALKSARLNGLKISDEASAIEAMGEQPLLIACSPNNIKITTPDDLHFADMLLRARTT